MSVQSPDLFGRVSTVEPVGGQFWARWSDRDPRACRRCKGPIEKYQQVCRDCRTLTCDWCGEEFEVNRPSEIEERRFCSPECHHNARRDKPPDLTVPDGQKWCMDCGQTKSLEEFDRRTEGRRHGRCRPCRRAYRDYSAERDWEMQRLRTWKRDGHLRLSREAWRRRARFHDHLRRVVRTLTRSEPTDRTCPVCTAEFVPSHGRQIYCSTTCSWRRAQSRRRARLRQAFVEEIDRAYVYERDGGECQLCGQPVDSRYSYPHPRSMVPDHIVPLARGGEHSHRNVQLAHRECNEAKGDGSEGSQLLLLG